MKTKIILLALGLLLSSKNVMADNKLTDCSSGYGPGAGNLTVLINDENKSRIDGIGYDADGVFFPFQVRGCSQIMISGTNLICDQSVIAQIGKPRLELEDTVYNGYRSNIQVDMSKVDLVGSCDRSKKLPLTFLVRR